MSDSEFDSEVDEGDLLALEGTVVMPTWINDQGSPPTLPCFLFYLCHTVDSVEFSVWGGDYICVNSFSWGMDVIGLIEPAASNGHRFILVAIDYFTKWVEAASYKAVTKKVMADFVRYNLICCFEVPESIITDNGANMNSHLMKEICYHTTIRTSTEATHYMLVYRTKAMIPTEVEIPFLRIIQEDGLSDAEWLYQQRMTRAFNKKVRVRTFEVGRLVLKCIFPHQEEYKGKFAPNWQGRYVVHKVLSRGTLVLAEMDGRVWRKTINSYAVKIYYI
ncbi:uncharacterized protein LOC125842709 [Solanum stenotomum]|uniref:uncharacterized protein LOC125842709 n=1 Tax=Solanum stenotomum TaxID=172797 RepID=UPI0020D084B9|nr:uncharacterized protein LOC125842709 [Solanum stenotomum]